MKPEQAPLQPAYPDMQESAGTDEGYGEAAPEPQAEAAAPESGAAKERRGKRRRRGGAGRKRPSATPKVQAEQNEAAEPVASDSVEDISAAAEPERTTADRTASQPQAHTPTKKQSRGTVVLTIGLPGSGKTSWFRRRAITPLSSDLLRMMLFDDIAEQRYQDLVFSTLRYLLRARMIARMPWNYVDATNLSPRERRGWIKMAQEFGYEVHAVFFDVPIDVCTERNSRRGRIVPEDVMQRMAGKLRPPTFEEGFSKITVVRVKKQQPSEPMSAIDNVVDDVEEPGGPGLADENY
ncbi:MAG TPA: ATP-binding protein [Terriglobales bacterium]|nr:ATP-binding protein [Terriglobales bacterium]